MKEQGIIRTQREIYSKNFIDNPRGPAATFNQTKSHQDLRYSKLFHWINFPVEKLSVFDVGCGIGELNDWLRLRVEHLNYCGNDIVPEMVNVAREKNPNCEIRGQDLLSDPQLPKADIYCLSGVFNFHGGTKTDEWSEYCRSMIRKMFKHAEIGICFNGLSTSADYFDRDMFYSCPTEWLNFLSEECTRFIGLKADYALFEYSIYALKPEWVRSCSLPELKRYVKL